MPSSGHAAFFGACAIISLATSSGAAPAPADDPAIIPDGGSVQISSEQPVAPAPQPSEHGAAAGPSDEKPAVKSQLVQQLQDAIRRGVEIIVSMQEGDDKAEWPYEGVYRVRGQIPIGYRVGGTGICGMALVLAPGYRDDPQRRAAIQRATTFIVNSPSNELMSPEYDGGYDVRGWGYTYGLSFLLLIKSQDVLPENSAPKVEQAIRFFIDAIQRTQIPQVGGWNYARKPGRDAVSPPAPFMTAPTLQALFEARKQGFGVDEAVVERAIKTLESARTATGSFLYSGTNGASAGAPTPGAIGRMVAGETTLLLAGRSTLANLRGAIDSFLTHWEWLNKRRAQNGTHEPPYQIAPYYFYYAHYYAAQAIEMLPKSERQEYRRRLDELLFSVRLDGGQWNDRVFPRSANFGTAMSIMAMMMPGLPAPARWKTEPVAPIPAPAKNGDG